MLGLLLWLSLWMNQTFSSIIMMILNLSQRHRSAFQMAINSNLVSNDWSQPIPQSAPKLPHGHFTFKLWNSGRWNSLYLLVVSRAWLVHLGLHHRPKINHKDLWLCAQKKHWIILLLITIMLQSELWEALRQRSVSVRSHQCDFFWFTSSGQRDINSPLRTTHTNTSINAAAFHFRFSQLCHYRPSLIKVCLSLGSGRTTSLTGVTLTANCNESTAGSHRAASPESWWRFWETYER